MARTSDFINLVFAPIHKPVTTYLTIRDDNDSPTQETCKTILNPGEVIISRTALIATFATLITLLAISWAILAAFIIREHLRRRRARAAKQWGRKSRFDARISMLRKEVDDSFSRQYSGVLQHVPENPCMGSDSPVELMLPDERIWEAPAVPAKATTLSAKSNARKSRAVSLFFDHAVNLWIPKR